MVRRALAAAFWLALLPAAPIVEARDNARLRRIYGKDAE